MTRATIKFDELLYALDYVSGAPPSENEAYLCVETGIIYYQSIYSDIDINDDFPSDTGDPEKYIAIPHKNDLDLGKRLALRFVSDFLQGSWHEVNDIFHHKGAYARFRHLLERHGLLQQWYDYEDESRKTELRQWCQDNEIELHD
jgi:hypothetical protein